MGYKVSNDKTDWNKLNIPKMYDLLARLLSEDADYEVKFIVTRKEDK